MQTLPALKSFCIFSCLGILGLFSLSITFFLACFTLDIQRTEQGRNACICCYKHKPDYKPNKCSQRNNFNIFLRKYYSKIILKLPVKVNFYMAEVFFFIILNNKACQNVVLFLLVAMWTHHYKLWPVCNVSTLIVDSGCGDQPGFVRTEHLGILQSQTRLWRQLVLPIRLLCTWIQRDEGQIFPRRGSHWRRLLQ